jgi:putative ABC transport system permease protein
MNAPAKWPKWAPSNKSGAGLTFRLALRELRGGLRGFYIFIACIALGVMAIAAVGSLANSLAEGLAREGRVILGGDMAFSLIQRETSTAERAFLASRGELSGVATMRAMARTLDGRAALVEVKAVDDAYPLYGGVVAEPAGDLATLLAQRDGAFGVVADPALLTRLDLRPGARLTVGAAAIELRAALVSEPDKLAGGIGFGPRLLMSEQALKATGLVQPGSLVRWLYRVRLPKNTGDDAAAQTIEAAKAQFPEAGWEIRNRTNAAPQLERNIERFSQYLSLVGLTALLIGGVGVANSTKHFLDRKRDVMAILKSIGATGSRVVAIYFVEVLILASIGVAIGLAIGAALPFALAAAFGAIMPLPLAPAFDPGQLALAAAYGMLTAATFSLWPLGRAHDVPVSALFRDQIAPLRRLPRWRYVIAAAMTAAAFVVLALTAAFDRKIAAIFIVAAVTVFGLLRLIASFVMVLARRFRTFSGPAP